MRKQKRKKYLAMKSTAMWRFRWASFCRALSEGAMKACKCMNKAVEKDHFNQQLRDDRDGF